MVNRLGGTKRKRKEEKLEEERSKKKKLRDAKRELLYQSYLKMKMIAESNNELLQVCKVMEKIKKM